MLAGRSVEGGVELFGRADQEVQGGAGLLACALHGGDATS